MLRDFHGKARLSEYLDSALRGERVVIARRNVPLVELKPIARPPAERRRLGQGPREEGYELPDGFWEPLPDALIAAFAGGEPKTEAPPASGRPGGA